MKIAPFTIGLMVTCALFSGCGSEQQSLPAEPLYLANTPGSQAMEAAQAVLDGDCILIGDLLEYELAPRAEQEARIVALLQELAAADTSRP